MPDVKEPNIGLSTPYSATLAAMDGPAARRRTRLSIAALAALVAVAAALPTAALAQSAGDQQYADPLAGDQGRQQQSQRGGGDAESPATGAPSATAPATGAVGPQTAGGDAGATASGSGAASLPRTGIDAAPLAALGVALLALGLALARPTRHARR